MKAYQLFSDSACDLPKALLEDHRIMLIPFYVSFDHENYYKENLEITNEHFYQTISAKNTHAKTSLPSVQDYITAFRPVLKEGQDILCLCLTQKFSGSYQSAVNAKLILEEQFPDSSIHVIDSIQATGGQGLLLLQMAAMKEAGLSVDEIVKLIDKIKGSARVMFTLDTLEYLKLGRRIGKAKALIREMIHLKPLIQLREAELIPYSNIRGRKKALGKVYDMVVEFFTEYCQSPEDYDFCVINATTDKDAQYLTKRLEEFIQRPIPYPVFQIGVTIGTYTGPGVIGICFVKRYDRY